MSTHASIDSKIDEFIARQQELLELELRSEADTSTNEIKDDHSNEQNGLTKLEIAEISVGLYGRTVVTLQCSTETQSNSSQREDKLYKNLLPSHRFTVGDEVAIIPKKNGKSLAGVIYKVTEESISVALFESKANEKKGSSKTLNEKIDEDDEESSVLSSNSSFSLVNRSNFDVHRKMLSALTELSKYGADHPIASPVLTEIFSPEYNEDFDMAPQIELINPYSSSLNRSQIEAISYSLSTPLSLIHGPPGTGKTTTLVELIHQFLTLNPNQKILVTAPSNIAVDTILQKCSTTLPKKFKMLRIGHPARIHNHTLPHSLEHKIHTSHDSQILQDVNKELKGQLQALNNHYDSFSSTSSTSKKNRLSPAQRRNCKKEITLLRKEIKQRHQKMIYSLVSSANIVFATNVGCATLSKKLSLPSSSHNSSSTSDVPNQSFFDLLIMDEAAQSLPPAALVPILLARKCVLAGDDRQLPPTITSQLAKNKKLDETFFDIIQNPNKRKLLDTQYRMHETISTWASDNMYNGRLKCADHVREQLLCDLENVEHIIGVTDVAMMLIDTAGCEFWEEQHSTSGSRSNREEASIVKRHVEELMSLGVRQQDVAIISPYNAQVELLRNLLLSEYPKIEIKSVDGFQGGERDAVILSLVRSNENWSKKDNGVGFLKDRRRINVAVTRAKRHIAVVCDSETVSRDEFLKCLVQWIHEEGDVRSAMEYSEGTMGQDSNFQNEDLDIVEKMLNSNLNISNLNDNDNSIVGSKVTPSGDRVRQRSTNVSSNNENPAQDAGQKKKDNDEKMELKRKLMTQIEVFSHTSKDGDELEFDCSLTRLERLLVHEIAEEKGFEHRSEGKEGSNRRVIVKLKKCEKNTEHNIDTTETGIMNLKSETLLSEARDKKANDKDKLEKEKMQKSNAILKDLAKERMQRQTGRGGLNESKEKGKIKKKKNRKKNKPKSNESQMSIDDDLDDMAFLEKEIQKVQTSHGRKVEGSGSTYRTIINGILIDKPKPKEAKRDKKAAAALHLKLKKAQQDRNPKKKK